LLPALGGARGLQRKAHRKRMGASEDLERKARLVANLLTQIRCSPMRPGFFAVCRNKCAQILNCDTGFQPRKLEKFKWVCSGSPVLSLTEAGFWGIFI
jgi:hypothetical protein